MLPRIMHLKFDKFIKLKFILNSQLYHSFDNLNEKVIFNKFSIIFIILLRYYEKKYQCF